MEESYELEKLAQMFKHHPPANISVTAGHNEVRRACHKAALTLRAVIGALGGGGSREEERAIESLEMAMFWGNAAIARHQRRFNDDCDGVEG